MKEVCFPLTSNPTLCKKHVVIDELKKLVKDVECCDDKSPICRAIKKAEETKTDDSRCYCGTAPGYHQHVMMDGQLAKSEISEAESTHRVVRPRWCPPCTLIQPLMDPISSCYRTDAARGTESERISARNGIPPEDSVSAVRVIPKAASVGDCRRTSTQQVRAKVSQQEKGAVQDEVFGGQHCPFEHPAPGTVHYYCPAGDPSHVHWSPPHTLECRYPNTCVASCFHHPAVHDWIYQQPKYKSYLQNTNDIPFKKGF